MMLDPAPETLLTFFQTDSGNNSSQHLCRLGHSKSTAGSLQLSVPDLLGNRPDDGAKHFGLRLGEGKLLQMYANECDFPSSKWLANAR
ncbi:MAG TPA: hypothetical protein VEL76_42485 [Gemmataceae bacterium]|nr:hypothetical protein [Gemmataceae bacterium]